MISYKPFTTLDAFKYRTGFSILKNMGMFTDIITTCCWSPIVWKNNVAKTDNFLSSSFLALDFDIPGDEDMVELNHSLQDHRRIVATTKSHQLPKNNITCDRYRLIIPFTETITDYQTYKATYTEALKKYHWADRSCLDGARFFFPSKTIVVVDRESEYTWDITRPKAALAEAVALPVTQGVIPTWCLEIINTGRILEASRNVTMFRVACGIFEAGFSESEVRRFLLKAKIDFNGVNIEGAIKSAKAKRK